MLQKQGFDKNCQTIAYILIICLNFQFINLKRSGRVILTGGGRIMQQQLRRPVWAEVNLDNLAHNIREVRRVTKADAMVTAVIKADGYGHGALKSEKLC